MSAILSHSFKWLCLKFYFRLSFSILPLPSPRGLCHVGLSLLPSPSPLSPRYPCLEGDYVCVLNSQSSFGYGSVKGPIGAEPAWGVGKILCLAVCRNLVFGYWCGSAGPVSCPQVAMWLMPRLRVVILFCLFSYVCVYRVLKLLVTCSSGRCPIFWLGMDWWEGPNCVLNCSFLMFFCMVVCY
jgi:hypothetical protein